MFKLPLLLQILFIPNFSCVSDVNFNDSEGELVSVAVIFRHGDRTPIDPYPTDPYRNASYWPVDFGQLTNIGKMQHFQLGQWLRNRYRDFLPNKYTKKDIYVRSTDVDRTLMSAETNLAGLFPPQADQIWNDNLKWQPIPIHTKPREDDNVLAMKKPCEKYDFLLKKLTQTPKFVKIHEENRELYEYISRNSGTEITNLKGLTHIYHVLMIETLYNFTLPEWTKEIFPTKMEAWADFSFAIPCYTPDLARLKIGPLINDILDRFKKASQRKGHKFLMYSAHDTTIANILNSLNVFDYHAPPYAATILFELRSLHGNFYVNILYKNTSVPQKIVLKGCGYYCPLERFAKIVKPIRVSAEDWESECKMKLLETAPFTALQSTVFVSGGVVLFMLTSSLVVSIACIMLRKRNRNYSRIPDENVNSNFICNY